MPWCWMNKTECRYKIIMYYGFNFMRTMYILKERKTERTKMFSEVPWVKEF